MRILAPAVRPQNISLSLPLHLSFIDFRLNVLLCAQLWCSFFTAVVRLLHKHEEGVPQPCASNIYTLFAQERCVLCIKDTLSLCKKYKAFVYSKQEERKRMYVCKQNLPTCLHTRLPTSYNQLANSRLHQSVQACR